MMTTTPMTTSDERDVEILDDAIRDLKASNNPPPLSLSQFLDHAQDIALDRSQPDDLRTEAMRALSVHLIAASPSPSPSARPSPAAAVAIVIAVVIAGLVSGVLVGLVLA